MRQPFLAASLACLALTTPSIASAKQTCIAPADVSAGVIYALPIAYDAAKSVCASRLDKDGFLATKGDALIAPFRVKQGKSWPGAFRLIKTYIEHQNDGKTNNGIDIMSTVSVLPESALRPFVDGVFGQMIAKEIKPNNCSNIERAMELLGPVPAENVAGIFTFIAEVSELKKPSICAPKKQ